MTHPCTDLHYSRTLKFFLDILPWNACFILLGGEGCKAAPYMCVSVCMRSSLLRSDLRFRRASFFPFSFSVLGIRSRISEITRRFCSFGSNVSFPPSPSVSRLCGFPIVSVLRQNEDISQIDANGCAECPDCHDQSRDPEHVQNASELPKYYCKEVTRYIKNSRTEPWMSFYAPGPHSSHQLCNLSP